MAKVTSRTLRHYDDIGLLAPAFVSVNGHRHYEEAQLLRLQRLLLLREHGLSLAVIGRVLDGSLEQVTALQQHEQWLRTEQDRLRLLTETVARTIKHVEAGAPVDASQLFEGFPEATDLLRMDIFEDGENEATVSTGVGDREVIISAWMESHSEDGGRGAHLAIRQARQAGAASIVVHVSRLPALVASMTEVALRLAQLWERDGAAYWAGQPVPAGKSPQDPAVTAAKASTVTAVERDEARIQRRAAKRELLNSVYASAPEVLSAFLNAQDDDDAAAALVQLLAISPDRATELVTHLQFRELTAASRRRHKSG